MLTRLARFGRELRDDERGMAAVWFAILALFVFFGFTFFIVNLSNTHEHRRHLQLQVDNGVLAAGSAFSGCFQAPANANANIAREAHRFSGDPTYPTNYFTGDPAYPTPYNTTSYPGPFNQQVENATRVRIGLNRPTFPPYGAPITDYDPTFDLRSDLSGVQNLPCASDILDVKATDIDIPTPFGGLVSSVSSVDVKARARVEIKKVKVLSGFLPWAVPEVRPKAVLAIFVDEANANTVRGVQLLNDTNTTPQLNGGPQELWVGDAQFVGHSQTGTGVVIATSSKVLATPPSGTLPQICNTAGITCYAGSSATSGLWYIQGFTNGSGTLAAPHLGQVTLGPGSCGDNSAPYFVFNGDCDVQVRANVDFGVAGNPTLAPNCAQVTVAGNAMAWQSGTLWTATKTVPDGSGRNGMTISWASGPRNNGTCGNRPNSGTFGPKAAAPYAADTASGPVDYLSVTAGGAFLGSLGTSTNTPNNVHVEVGLRPPLRVAASATEPPILLRFAGGHGSKTQALQCDKQLQLEDMVRDGCKTQYAVNERGEVCSGGTPPGPTWTVANLPPPLPPPQPNPVPDCIQWKTGQVTSMSKGLKARFESPCSLNEWATFRARGELPLPSDKRWVSLIVADASNFDGSGNGVTPIRVFAGFYVTGWFLTNNPPGTNGCPGNDPHPLGYPADSTKASGDVWGYFVTNVILGGTGVSNEFCAFNEIGLCFASLTQ